MKLYTTIAVFMMAIQVVTAQLSTQPITKRSIQKAHSQTSTNFRHRSIPNKSLSILWSDDFSNASNWVIDHEVGTSGDWIIGTQTPSAMLPIQSVSAANGYALFDSGLDCSGNQIGNITTANPIDLSGHPAIKLEFSQYYLRYYDSTYVYISVDSINWNRYEVNGNLLLGEYSGNDPNLNPDVVSIDISSVAGNQSTVWIRFQFYSPSSLDILAGCAFSWMIDDVNISDIPTIDGTAYQRAFGGEYSVISLLNSEAFNMSGRIVNTGADTIASGNLTFNVYNSGGQVYTSLSTTSAPILSGDTSALLTSIGTYAPIDTGLYVIEQIASVTGDINSYNDTAYAYVLVNDSTNARDYYAIDSLNYFSGFGYSQGNIGAMGQMFHIYQTSQLTSGTFYLTKPTLGDRTKLTVYSVVAGQPTSTVLGESSIYFITADDTAGRFITLPFISPINVSSGDFFLAIDQLDTNILNLGASNDIYTSGKIFYNGSGTGWVDVAGQVELSFILRLNNPSSTLVSVPTINASDAFSVYPNPSKGYVYIMSNGNERNVTVNVINTLGKVVKSVSFGTFSNEKIDLSTMASGSYTFQIISENGIGNKTIVLSTK